MTKIKTKKSVEQKDSCAFKCDRWAQFLSVRRIIGTRIAVVPSEKNEKHEDHNCTLKENHPVGGVGEREFKSSTTEFVDEGSMSTYTSRSNTCKNFCSKCSLNEAPPFDSSCKKKYLAYEYFSDSFFTSIFSFQKSQKIFTSLFFFLFIFLLFPSFTNANILNASSSQPEISVVFDEDILNTSFTAQFTNDVGISVPASFQTLEPDSAFLFTPIHPLSNGLYTFSLLATDFVKNAVNESVQVFINESYMKIELLSPYLGGSSISVTDILLKTEKESQCGFAGVDGKSFESLISKFDSLSDGKYQTLHTYKNFDFQAAGSLSSKRTIFVQCMDQKGRVHFASFNLVYDATLPQVRITPVPNPITQKDDNGKISTTLFVVSDDPVNCRYHFSKEGEDSNITELLNYSKFTPFLIEDGSSSSHFKKTPSYILEPPLNKANETQKQSFIYTMQCSNIAGLYSEKKQITIDVDLLAPIIISLQSPSAYTSELEIVMNVTTNKKASCKFSEGKTFDEDKIKNFDDSTGLRHTVSLGALSDGTQTYTVRCVDEINVQTTTLSFIVDRTAPDEVTVDSPDLACSKTFSATFKGLDAQSPIKEYNYSLIGSDGNILVDWTATSSSSVSIDLGTKESKKKQSSKKQNNAKNSSSSSSISQSNSQSGSSSETNLTQGFVYRFEVTAKNAVGLWSSVGSSNGTVYEEGGIPCDKTPPFVTLAKNNTKTGVLVQFICFDADTGCDEDSYQYFLTNINNSKCAGKNATYNPYSPISKNSLTNGTFTFLVPQTSFVCYSASDLAGNNASGVLQITVKINETLDGTNACQNKIKDVSESDVDCGGSFCLACSEGKKCTLSKDCASQYCLNSICTPASCTDNVKNGFETGLDCGGTCTVGCSVGSICNKNTDCESNYCDASYTCAESSCSDGARDGDETDRDCGGPCASCSIGKACNANTDCLTSICGKYKTCEGQLPPVIEQPITPVTPIENNLGSLLRPKFLILYLGIAFILIGLIYNSIYDRKEKMFKRSSPQVKSFFDVGRVQGGSEQIKREQNERRESLQRTPSLNEQMQSIIAQTRLKKEHQNQEKARKGIFDSFGDKKENETKKSKDAENKIFQSKNSEGKYSEGKNFESKSSYHKISDKIPDKILENKMMGNKSNGLLRNKIIPEKEDSFSRLERMKGKEEDVFGKLEKIKKKK